MQYLNFNEIRNLNIDINSACNAACPGCARQQDGIFRNMEFQKNQHFPYHIWQKLIDEIGPQLESIVFCGNYGDAGMTNNLADFITYAHSVNPRLNMTVTSNMGVNSTQFWKNLGELSTDIPIHFQCSIDGLRDTNHIYRRFVIWKKVMDNVLALANTSPPNLIWKWIEFPWNTHQIEQGTTISKILGFTEFIVTPNNQPHTNLLLEKLYLDNKDIWSDAASFVSVPPAPPQTDEYLLDASIALKIETDRFNMNNKVDSIDCYTKTVDQSIHIDWNGHVWPCCWWGGAHYSASLDLRHSQKSFYPDIATEWNSLSDHTLAHILNHKFYSESLMTSQDSDTPSSVCLSSCGKCDNNWNSVNTIGKTN